MTFRYLIMQWYAKNKRDLPWRHTSDPYRIWVSEVILQQTRVEQGLDYYHRFLEKYPDIDALAMAEEEDVMKVWQGLGYYSRARNMHQAAKTIQSSHGSVFPATYDEIRRLKGIGDYSASAISSIAYGKPHPVIDGNVLRLVARYAGIADPVNSSTGKKKVKAFLDAQIDPDDPGNFNQAAMEMGAMVCKPRQPLCEKCPLSESCFAFIYRKADLLPVLKKPKLPVVRYFNYLVIFTEENGELYTWIRKRTGNDIWRNLYDFPLIETDHEATAEELTGKDEWEDIAGKYSLTIGQSITQPKYLLSHRELRVRFLIIQSAKYGNENFKKISFSEIHNYPIPRLIEIFLENFSSRPGIFQKNPD